MRRRIHFPRCTLCDEEILPGEDYLMNQQNDIAHKECVSTIDAFCEFEGIDTVDELMDSIGVVWWEMTTDFVEEMALA